MIVHYFLTALILVHFLQLLSHPLHTLKLVKRDALRTVERRGVKWLWSTFTTKQLYWLLAVYFLPMMTLQVVVSSVSTAIFNGAIVFMALVTMQIAINSERLHSRMEYISVFQCFNRGRAQIRPPIPKRDAVHYLTFTVGLVVAIVSLGLSNHSFIYYEVLVIVCVVVSGLVMMEFDLYESSLFWFFMAAKAPSWLVVGVEKFCSLFSLSSPALFSTLQSPLWTPVVLFGSVTLEISYLSIIQVSLHLALLTFKFNDFGWKKFLSELGPLLLFFCWLVLSRYFVVRSSALHLAVMSAGLLLLPLTTCVFIASPLLFLYWYWFTAPFYYSVAAVAISAAVSGVIAVSFKYRRSWWMNLPIEYIILGSLLLLLGVVLFLSAWYGSVFQVTTPLPPVSAREYREYCGQQNWARGNAVQTQINCIHLQGRVLTASGEVQTVGISEVVDTRANSLKLFPYFLQRAITCHLGRYSPMCGNRDDMSTCVYNGCHFQHSLAYTFEIKLTINVDGSKGMPATLLVSGHHKEFVMNLTSGMTLHFNATFVSGMGSERVVLRAVFLDAAGLDDTQSLLEEREEGIRMGMLSTLVQSVKNSVAILFEVFLGYIVQDQ